MGEPRDADLVEAAARSNAGGATGLPLRDGRIRASRPRQLGRAGLNGRYQRGDRPRAFATRRPYPFSCAPHYDPASPDHRPPGP
jgi:hypothetical protein